MHIWIELTFAIITFSSVNIQAIQWQPPNEYKQVPIWPGNPPNSKPVISTEEFKKSEKLINGQTWYEITNVETPTFTVYPPKGILSDAGIIVFPGGGYWGLAIDLEGTEVCDWFSSNGITCILLKYRVPGSGPHWNPILNKRVFPKVHTALQDAQRTISLIRHNSKNWNLNPNKIGVIGFSAGGHLVAAISTEENRIYTKIDDADNVSVRPNFAIALYPGHLSINYKQNLSKLNPTIHVSEKTPPTLLFHAQDDPMNPVEYSLLYYNELRRFKVPVEMHLFSQGGHAFGLRKSENPISHWPDLAFIWLKTIGIIKK